MYRNNNFIAVLQRFSFIGMTNHATKVYMKNIFAILIKNCNFATAM